MKTLGEEEPWLDDAAAWIERSRALQREKELAEKRVGGDPKSPKKFSLLDWERGKREIFAMGNFCHSCSSTGRGLSQGCVTDGALVPQALPGPPGPRGAPGSQVGLSCDLQHIPCAACSMDPSQTPFWGQAGPWSHSLLAGFCPRAAQTLLRWSQDMGISLIPASPRSQLPGPPFHGHTAEHPSFPRAEQVTQDPEGSQGCL